MAKDWNEYLKEVEKSLREVLSKTLFGFVHTNLYITTITIETDEAEDVNIFGLTFICQCEVGDTFREVELFIPFPYIDDIDFIKGAFYTQYICDEEND